MKYVIVVLFMSLASMSVAQESNLGNWIVYSGSKKVDDRWNIHHEVQLRNYNAIGDLEQLLLRTGLGYTLKGSGANVLLGYGFIHGQNYVDDQSEKTRSNEHRIFQQLITKQQISRIAISHRYRFEQRWVNDNPLKLRFRYALGVKVPLNESTIQKGTFYAAAYNEVFIDTDEQPFDRNRTYGGIGYMPIESLNLELGYMNQFFAQDGRDQINIIAVYKF